MWAGTSAPSPAARSRPPPRARGAALGRRHELHAGARRREGAARAPARDPAAAARRLVVIRELAENPNVHQPLGRGRELFTDPAGRYAIYLTRGSGPHSATVQRVRLGPGEVERAVAEIRAFLRGRGRSGAEWELGESSTPTDLVARLANLG